MHTQNAENSLGVIIIIIKTWSSMQGLERTIYVWLVQRPKPTIPTNRKKEEKKNISEHSQGASCLWHQKNIGTVLESRQSHTIE